MDTFNHSRSPRSKWRFPLGGLLCVILPFMIVAWGTAYKLSLYKTTKTGTPAKVCTRGSDAAKSSVSQAVDGRKAVGNGTALALPVSTCLVVAEHQSLVLPKPFQSIHSLQSVPVLSARPPPVGFLFS